MTKDRIKVGFVGLGIMGAPMAANLLKAGYPLAVYNRTPERTRALAELGAEVKASPADTAREAEVVIVIVSDSPDVEEVVTGRRGILEGVRDGSTVVDMSTVSPALERRLAEALGEKGARLIDAPVSGGDVGAREASLSIMAGGEQEVFEEIRPVLEAMGRVTYCGPVGCGQLTKLCNQILVAVTLLGVSEALVFARKSGLDPLKVIEAVKGGAAGSWLLSHLGPRMAGRDFAPGFKADLMGKDLRLILEAADSSATSLPGTALAGQLFSSLRAMGEGEAGMQALIKVLEELSGLEPGAGPGSLS